ncbi:MAG: Rieske 2Fe-2S domain-containing protein [bacterium]
MTQFEKIKIANTEIKEQCPLNIKIYKENYFLVYSEERGFQLLSNQCPHMGGKVVLNDDCLVCPVHFWKFDKHTGKSKNIENQELRNVPILKEGNELFVKNTDLIRKNDIKKKSDHWVSGLNCVLHSHACIEFNYKGTKIMTDPWLSGPAFLGSWYQYPKNTILPEEIVVDYIIITHEHSDHFHIPTLKKINKNIPILIPDFPNQRMQNSLEKLGFKHILIPSFGKKMSIESDLEVTFFEPKGVWNDSIILFQFGSFKWLNLNDAGINQNLVNKVFPVDVVSSTFSFGASGYPLTWNSVSNKDAHQFMVDSNNGRIEQIRHAMDIYGAKYFVPFASHITFCHPTHIEFLEKIIRNNIFDIKERLNKESFKVIDWFPGDEWNVEKLKIKRKKKLSKEIYNKDILKKFAIKEFNSREFNKLFKRNNVFNEEVSRKYFLDLNNCPQIKFCENTTIRFNLTNMDYETLKTLYIEIKDCKLRYLGPVQLEDLHIQINIPICIFNLILDEKLSWDEAFVGYWCRFFRENDEYKVGFWRLLQAPYYKKSDKNLKEGGVLLNTSVEEIIRTYGCDSVKVLNRFGLYCHSCELAHSESLETAMNKHGLTDVQKKQIISEISFKIDAT